MFEYIKGKLINIDPIYATVDVNGIGYKIFVPTNTFSNTSINQEVLFYTSLIIKEDSHSIYGFLSVEERDLFISLCSISGIGPKTALALISHLDSSSFYQAILENDSRLISKVPGIGKKTAERLIIEMKDQHKLLEKLDKSSSSTASFPITQDALRALIHLGYHPMKAKKAVDFAFRENPEANTATLISVALRKI